MNDKFKNWWRKYDDVEKCRLIKDKSIEVNNNHKKMVKASDSEFNSNASRKGIRGGKRTSLIAKSQTAIETYYNSLDELKYMVSTI